MSFLNKIIFEFLGWKTNRAIFDAQKYLTKVKENEWYFISLSHDQLREKTIEFKAKLAKKTKQSVKYDNIDAKKTIYKVIDKKKKTLLALRKRYY